MSLPPLPPAGHARPGYIYNADNEICGHALPTLYYTADQMREYGKACREQALEEAAMVCESEYDNWDNERPLRICATAIRNLK